MHTFNPTKTCNVDIYYSYQEVHVFICRNQYKKNSIEKLNLAQRTFYRRKFARLLATDHFDPMYDTIVT